MDADTSITNVTGKAGQFIEDLSAEVSKIGMGSPSDTIGISLTTPLILNAGTGITLSRDGVEFDGSSRLEQTISIGQSVATTDNVTFAQVSASSFITDTVTYDGSSITGDISVTGSLTTTGDLTVDGNATIGGIVTAQEFHTEFVSGSIIYASGSTQFGDTLDDTHNFTGSLLVTGSITLNGSSAMIEVSNDTSLADGSATSFVTENAVKTYVDDQTSTQQTYLRKQYVKTTASITVPATASFTAVTASAPTGMTSTSENDFIFFINGQYMEHDAIAIQQNGSTLLLKVDNDSIGYLLESDDEILAIGKFNS